MPRPPTRGLTAAQEILFGALELHNAGQSEFTEWDLTVAVWKRNPNRFGCRGYENEYPDHKRVMMEIMGTTKKDNPVRRGWLEKTRPNHYRITDLGLSEVGRLSYSRSVDQKSHRSPQAIYDAVAPYYRNPVFRKHCKDSDEPRMWLGAASFLSLTKSDPQHLDDRLHATAAAIENTLTWLEENDANQIHRGVSGGSEAIHKDSLLRLKKFLQVIEERFAKEIEAIRKTKR